MNGFLPYHAPFIMDFIVVSMGVVIAVLIYGIMQAKKRHYRDHAKTMIFLCGLLLMITVLFETNMISLGGIRGVLETANRETAYNNYFSKILFIHLIFAFSTCALMIYVLSAGIKNFGLKNPHPGPYSKKHRFYARLSVLGIFGVAITGFYVYYLAFVKALE